MGCLHVRASMGTSMKLGSMLAAVLVLALAGCGGGADTTLNEDTGGDDSGGGDTGGSDTSIPAPWQKFITASSVCGSSVSVRRDGDVMVVEANGIPNHGS